MNTKTKQTLTSLVLGLGLALALLGLLTTLSSDTGTPRVAYAAPGDVYCVTPGGGTYPGCDQVFTNVQAAVDAATGGEEIRVATGIYTGINAYGGLAQVVYLSKTLTIRGGYSSDFSTWDPTSDPTILDAQGQGRVLYIEGIISPTIEGLHITNGSGVGLGGSLGEGGAGGGVYVIAPEATFENCEIANNMARVGGGMYIKYGTVVLNDNVFTTNNADQAGAMFLENGVATLNNNMIINNTAEAGGGLILYESDVTLNNNLIADNAAYQIAGGLSLLFSSGSLNNNTIIGNIANDGGGLSIHGNTPILNGNLIKANRAKNVTSDVGGGILLADLTNALLTNNIVAQNTPIGINVRGASPHLVHNTLAYNELFGIYVTNDYINTSTLALTNTILVGHDTGVFVDPGSTASLESTLWGNVTEWAGPGTIFTGTNNYWGSPDFVDLTHGVYHVGAASTAIDRGTSTTLSYDIDSEARPQGTQPDLGADEVLELSIVKSAPLTADRGDAITYTLTVINNGASPLTNLIITDSIPAGATYLSGGSRVGDMVSWTVASLAAHTATQVTYMVTASANLFNNDYRVSADGGYNATGKVTAITLINDRHCWVRLNDGATEYNTIQAAVDASTSPGDVVKVAGYCTPSNSDSHQVVYLNKTLTIRGGYIATNWTTSDPIANPTTVDARKRGRGIYITGSVNTPTIEGLRIINGTAWEFGGYPGQSDYYHNGGGVYVDQATVTFKNNQIFHNWGLHGGGVFLYGGHSIFDGNEITANYGDEGGGLYMDSSHATLTGNDIFGNSAGEGGGAYVERSGLILSSNTIGHNAVHGYGGGMYLSWANGTFNHNIISGNQANYGGGLYMQSVNSGTFSENLISANNALVGGGLYLSISNATFNRNQITANTAREEAGGLYVSGNAKFYNNFITDNHSERIGSGLYIYGSASDFIHNTIARNSGSGGVYVGYSSSPNFVNTIVASHTIGLQTGLGGTATLHNTLWYGNGTNWSGSVSRSNDYFGTPDFITPNAGDYHLGMASIAIDRGITTTITDDIDGDMRPQGLAPDLGADERPAPTLTIVKSGPDTALPGEPITYTLTITNMGGITATHPVVTDVIPSGASYVSGGSLVGDVVRWTIPDLEPGISTTVQLVVTATQTIINRDYGVSADGGYGATGRLAVVTLFPQGCEAYPIALHEDSITGLQPGDSTGPIYRGTGVGNFNWLSWNPDLSSESYLIQELRNPGLSLSDFTDAQDPGDHSLNHGDWVWGVRGAVNSNNLTYELARLKATGTTLRIIVWDTAMGIGADVSHHALRFILAKIGDFDLSQQPEWITFTYVAEAENPETCRDFGLTLAADGAQTGLPGQGIRYIHTLTNQGHYTETASVTYTTTLADWPISLNPISQTLDPGQAVTVTAIVTIPLDSLEGLTNVTYITATLKSNNAISATVVDTTTTGTIDLLINKSGPVTATARDLITYTLTVTNSGSVAANNIVITDAIPIGANYVGGGAQVGDVVSWTSPGLAAGNSTVAQLVVTATQTITNSNYRVSADGGYSATGITGVVTIITMDGDLSNHRLYLPVIFKQ